MTKFIDLDKLREKAQAHHPEPLEDDPFALWCRTCAEDWPCEVWTGAADPTAILALIDRLQRVETALRALFDTGAWHVASDDDGQETDNIECWYCAAQAPDDGNPDPEHAPRCTWVAARAILADTAADAERWLADVRRLAVEEERERLLAFVNNEDNHVGGVWGDYGEIVISVGMFRDALVGRATPPETDPDQAYTNRDRAVLANLSTAATEHDERIRQAALSQFTPERIGQAIFDEWQKLYGPAGSAAAGEAIQAQAMGAALYAALANRTTAPESSP